MAEENAVKASEEKPRATRRGPRAKAHEEVKQEEVQPSPVTDPAEQEAVQPEGQGVTEVKSKPTGLQDNPRIVKVGDPIEVDTDDNGVAKETVVREAKLPGSDAVTYYLVASKGTRYNN